MSNEIKEEATSRGFGLVTMTDLYNIEFSIQKSSLATKDAIWIGPKDLVCQITTTDAKRLGIPIVNEENGWVNYPIPDCVVVSRRNHLDQEQVAKIIPILQRFVDTGEL